MNDILRMLGMWSLGIVVGVSITMVYYKHNPMDQSEQSIEARTAVYGEFQSHKSLLRDMSEARSIYRLVIDPDDTVDRGRDACIRWAIDETLARLNWDFVRKHPGMVNALLSSKTAIECKYRTSIIVEVPDAEQPDGSIIGK